MGTFETLEICFSANLNGVDAQLKALVTQLDGLSGSALKADTSLEAAGRGLVNGLERGFAAALPGLGQRLTGTGRELGLWLGQAVAGSGAEGHGCELSERFGEGIRSGLPRVSEAAGRTVDAAAFDGGTGAARSAGSALSEVFAAGICGGLPRVSEAAGRTVDAAAFDGGTGAARSAGRALSEGFAAGIRDRMGAVVSAATAVANAATQRIRAALQIHSPSRVARGFGADFGEGFASGISGSAESVGRAAELLAGAAGAGLNPVELPEVETSMDRQIQTAVERALGDVQVTIPLNVDGMKLGEASIRGINQVTRSTGKVLLNL